MKKILYVLCFGIFLLDRYLKDFSNLEKTINTGISFSIKLDTRILFLLIGFLIIILTLACLRKQVISHLSLKLSTVYCILSNNFSDNKISFSLIILGGLSNILDRFLYGGVVDYLNFFGLLKNNLADYLIFLGFLLFLVHNLTFQVSRAVTKPLL